MPDDKTARKAQSRGIVRVRTIHPDPAHPEEYVHIYVVRKAGRRGGHTVAGPVKERKE